MNHAEHVETNIPADSAAERAAREKREMRQTLALTAVLFVVIGMFGFAWANAEYFSRLCVRLGILAPPAVELAEGAPGALGRNLMVHFSATVGDNLPVSFDVVKKSQKTRTGQREINDYRFVNLSPRTIYFRPVHTLFPVQASEALTLEKCFCFDEQVLEPGQSYTLPVVYIFREKDLAPGTSTIRMQYTLFESTKERYEAANAPVDGAAPAPEHGAAPAAGE